MPRAFRGLFKKRGDGKLRARTATRCALFSRLICGLIVPILASALRSPILVRLGATGSDAPRHLAGDWFMLHLMLESQPSSCSSSTAESCSFPARSICLRHNAARNSDVLASSMDLSSRTRKKRGNRRLNPLSSLTNPIAAV